MLNYLELNVPHTFEIECVIPFFVIYKIAFTYFTNYKTENSDYKSTFKIMNFELKFALLTLTQAAVLQAAVFPMLHLT